MGIQLLWSFVSIREGIGNDSVRFEDQESSREHHPTGFDHSDRALAQESSKSVCFIPMMKIAGWYITESSYPRGFSARKRREPSL